MDLHGDACYRAFRTRDARFDGRLFGGCRTTGIYCRPVCPARTPKREHMVFFPTAAAAHEAGFRPCLRCRPETAPELAAWRGTSNTVSRALSLMEGGALGEARVARVAERLGVGERQLRRLFRTHVGASPVAVAQTRRVLLARQLIHETRLSMADVALASGFGSIRRFNDVFHGLYGRPPSSLRRRATARARPEPRQELVVLLRYRPPYDWPAMLSFLSARAIPGVEVVSGDRYARTFEMGRTHGVVAVEPGAGNALRVAIRFPRISALPAIVARVRRVFDLDADTEGIGAHLAQDRTLAGLVARRPGLRLPGAWDGFELAVRAVLGQQITVRGAIGLAARLVLLAGEPLVGGAGEPLAGGAGEPLAEGAGAAGTLTHVFPRPDRVAAADLTTLGMPRMRAAALSSLAAAVAEDPALLAPGPSLEECVRRLRALPGVGDWTAHYIAMRELREPDAFPADDAGLLRAMAVIDGRRPTARELLARAERWRPWRAYAAQHLWASG